MCARGLIEALPNSPTPRPAWRLRKSFSSILLLISAPECLSHARKAWLSASKGSMCVCERVDVEAG